MEVLGLNSNRSLLPSENIIKHHCYYLPHLSIPSSSSSLINSVRDEDLKSLIARRKLHLVLDLDNTLVHSQPITKLSKHDRKYLTNPLVKKERLYMGQQHMIKLRPYVQTFLQEASEFFDFSVFTLGTRRYAKEVLAILDPENLYFASSLLITREDCSSTPMKKGLHHMLSHERVTLVVDDRADFWYDNVKNLVKIEPYEFFDDDIKSSKTSWSELQGDESRTHGELARVLRQLKKIHTEFYSKKECNGGDDYENRDVREAIEEVKKQFKFIGTKAHLETLRRTISLD